MSKAEPKPDMVWISSSTTGGGKTMHLDEQCHNLQKAKSQYRKDRAVLLECNTTWCKECADD